MNTSNIKTSKDLYEPIYLIGPKLHKLTLNYRCTAVF